MPPRITGINDYTITYDAADIQQAAVQGWYTGGSTDFVLSNEIKDMIQKIVDKRVEELLTSKDFILGKLPDKAEEIPFDSI